MYRWLSEPINAIDRPGRWKGRGRGRGGVGRRREIAKDNRMQRTSGNILLRSCFSFSSAGRAAPVEREDQIPTERGGPEGPRLRTRWQKAEAAYLSGGSVGPAVVGQGWNSREVAVHTSPSAHNAPVRAHHPRRCGWAVLGTQRHPSSHRRFWIVMRSRGCEVSVHAQLHLSSREGERVIS